MNGGFIYVNSFIISCLMVVNKSPLFERRHFGSLLGSCDEMVTF